MLQNIRKKIALLASCLLFAGTCLPAHADEESFVLIRDENNQVQLITETDQISGYSRSDSHYICTYSKGEHGEILFSSQYRFTQMCYAVTDGSEIPEEFIHPWWWDEDSLFQITAEEIDPADFTLSDLDYTDGQPNLLSYSEGYEDWFSQYPEGARLFAISYSNEYREDWERYSKELSLYDGVLDVFYKWEDRRGTAMWDGGTLFAYTREYSNSISNDEQSLSEEFSQEDVQELHTHCAEYRLWLEKWNTWIASVDTANMTPAEIEASRIAAGIESEYDMTMKHVTFVSELSEKYPGKINTSFLSFSHTAYAPATIHVQSVWETVGDPDGDGRISSADAAVILTIAADKGARNRNHLTGEITNSDLNSDGKADAADAALLLQYAAQCGAGKSATLKEFIKSVQNG